MWVIISTSSIITPNFRKLPLNNSSLVIPSYGSLVTPSNSDFDNFLCSLVLDAPSTGLNLYLNICHARKVLPLIKTSVADSSVI